MTADSKAELYKEQVVSEFDLQTARNEQIAAEAALAQAKAQEVNARNDLSYTEVKKSGGRGSQYDSLSCRGVGEQ